MFATGVLGIWLLLALVGVVVTVWWSLRMWRRRGELSPPARVLAAVIAVSAVVGALGSAVGLLKAFGGVGGESVDPSQRARVLGEGIADAMNSTALGVAVWIPSVVALALLMRKRGEKA